MTPLWTRPAPAARHAVRHERRESGWCTVEPEVLALAARDDERRHAHRPVPVLWPAVTSTPGHVDAVVTTCWEMRPDGSIRRVTMGGAR